MESSYQAPGTESSVLPFTQFNNMTSKLYNADKDTRQDDFHNQMKRQVKYLSDTSKEFSKKFNKRKRK